MKRLICPLLVTILATSFVMHASANNVIIADSSMQIQEVDADSTLKRNNSSNIEVNGKIIEIANNHGDTVVIRIGDEILRFPRNNRKEKRTEKKEMRINCFQGHYAGLNFGKPQLINTDYGMYADPYNEFMDLNSKNSIEFNINFAEKQFALNKQKSIGLVTGLGLSWGNYHFENKITLDKQNGMIVPVSLSNLNKIKKSKLLALYLDLPMMLEFQLRESNTKAPLYFAVGGIAGVKLGSHTKIKHSNGKDKDHGSFYLSPFRYGATVRVGYENIYIYGNYYANDFFESNRGPIMNQYTIGIGFTD